MSAALDHGHWPAAAPDEPFGPSVWVNLLASLERELGPIRWIECWGPNGMTRLHKGDHVWLLSSIDTARAIYGELEDGETAGDITALFSKHLIYWWAHHDFWRAYENLREFDADKFINELVIEDEWIAFAKILTPGEIRWAVENGADFAADEQGECEAEARSLAWERNEIRRMPHASPRKTRG